MAGEGLPIINLELENQSYQANAFVNRVGEYTQQMLNDLPMISQRRGEVAGLDVYVQQYKKQSEDNTRVRLLLAEDLCDRIEELVDNERLGSRSAPADARLNYRAPVVDEADRCPNCVERPTALHLGATAVCVRCYFRQG